MTFSSPSHANRLTPNAPHSRARSSPCSRRACSPFIASTLAALLLSTGCAHRNGPSSASNRSSVASTQPMVAAAEDQIVTLSNTRGGVPQPDQRRFATPEQAAATFKDAVATRNRGELLSLFGQEGSQLIFSGDRVQENNDLTAFAQRMSEYLHVDRPTPSKAVLLIGKENWPFPIPLVKSGNEWFFDTAAGREELLNRRIGEDELNAIAVCRAYVAAQREYARKDRNGDGVVEYAQHFMSRPGGKHDGLYWEAGPGEEISPMGPLVAEARLEGYPAASQPSTGKPRPYHGYVFHILKAQGDAAPGGRMSYVDNGHMTKGFAMVAYPSKYGASGIMTFIVGKDGKVYQKDLGEQTRETVSAMTEYNPDKSWTEVKE